MVDPTKIVSDAEQGANAYVKAEAPKVGNWFMQPWPRWVAFAALVLGLLVGRFA